MTLAELEKFVTGPAIYKSHNAYYKIHPTPAQKRKPDEMENDFYDEQSYEDAQLYRLTLSKLFPAPRDDEKRVEPRLGRIMFLKLLYHKLQRRFCPSPMPCHKKMNRGYSLCSQQQFAMSIPPTQDNFQPASDHQAQFSLDTGKFTDLVIPGIQSPVTPMDQTTSNHHQTYNACFEYQQSAFTKEQSEINGVDTEQAIDNVHMEIEVDSTSSTVINSPTEIVDNESIPSFESIPEFHSLVQFSPKGSSSTTAVEADKPNANGDELDHIMQVIVDNYNEFAKQSDEKSEKSCL